MLAPSSRADEAAALARLRRRALAGYGLQALSLVLALLGDGVVVTAFIVVLPALAGFVLTHWQRDAARGTALEPHWAWQARSFRLSALGVTLATLVLGPLLFVGLSLLWFAYALIGLWLTWRVARGSWALLKSTPLPIDQPAVTRNGSEE